MLPQYFSTDIGKLLHIAAPSALQPEGDVGFAVLTHSRGSAQGAGAVSGSKGDCGLRTSDEMNSQTRAEAGAG